MARPFDDNINEDQKPSNSSSGNGRRRPSMSDHRKKTNPILKVVNRVLRRKSLSKQTKESKMKVESEADSAGSATTSVTECDHGMEQTSSFSFHQDAFKENFATPFMEVDDDFEKGKKMGKCQEASSVQKIKDRLFHLYARVNNQTDPQITSGGGFFDPETIMTTIDVIIADQMTYSAVIRRGFDTASTYGLQRPDVEAAVRWNLERRASVFDDEQDLIRAALHVQEFSYFQASPTLLPETIPTPLESPTPSLSQSLQRRRSSLEEQSLDEISNEEVAREIVKQIDLERTARDIRAFSTTLTVPIPIVNRLLTPNVLNSRGESPAPDDQNGPNNSDLCRYCRLRPISTFFLPCGHRAACDACAAIAVQCICCQTYISAKLPFSRS